MMQAVIYMIIAAAFFVLGYLAAHMATFRYMEDISAQAVDKDDVIFAINSSLLPDRDKNAAVWNGALMDVRDRLNL